LIFSSCFANAEQKPNFIIINCDDMGYGDMGCFGHPTIKTPELDRMAYEGQRWTSFYVAASVSSPSRSGLMTGRLGIHTGMYGDKRVVLFPDSPKGLPKEELTMATILKNEGYNTACFGKWHLGHKPEAMPWSRGFDEFYGIPYSNDMSQKEQKNVYGNKNYKYPLPFYENDKVLEFEPDQTQFTKRLTIRAVQYIREQTEKPFFLYLAHPMPHVPVYASEKFQNTSKRGQYGDVIEEIDWSVGQILKTLKEKNLDKNTLVIFTSDNGPWLTFKENGGSAGLLKDGKNSTYEGGFRVPCIMWGAMLKPGVISEMGSTLDLLPTFCEMANIKLPSDRKYDGFSLYPTLTKQENIKREYYYFYRGSELYAVRKGKYKIHFMTKQAYGPGKKIILKTPLLYNIEEDPEERYDIADKYPEIVKELEAYTQQYKAHETIKESIFDLPAEKQSTNSRLKN